MNELFVTFFNFIFKKKTKIPEMNNQSSSKLNYQQFFKYKFSILPSSFLFFNVIHVIKTIRSLPMKERKKKSEESL